VFFSNPFIVCNLRVEGCHGKPKEQVNIVLKQFVVIKTTKMLFGE